MQLEQGYDNLPPVCAWLDQRKLRPGILLRWLDGVDLPEQRPEPPYQTVLRALPQWQQSLSLYREKLSRVAAGLLDELKLAGGYPPEEITHRALSGLFYLCASLEQAEILADPLANYYETMAPRGPEALGLTPRFALRMALERNQAGNRLESLWMRMLHGKESFLPGSCEDAFAALGRCFHATVLAVPHPEGDPQQIESAVPMITPFTEALLCLLHWAEGNAPGEAPARIDSALEKWHVRYPALRRPLLLFTLNARYNPDFPASVRSLLERRLHANRASLEHQVTSAQKHFRPFPRFAQLLPELVTSIENEIEEQSVTVLTPKRLWNIMQIVMRQNGFKQKSPQGKAVAKPANGAPYYSKRAMAGCA